MRIVVVSPQTSYTQKPDEYVYYEFAEPWPVPAEVHVRSSLPRALKDSLHVDRVSLETVKADVARDGDASAKSRVNKSLVTGTVYRIWGGVAGAWFTLECAGQAVKIHVSALDAASAV